MSGGGVGHYLSMNAAVMQVPMWMLQTVHVTIFM